MILLEPDTPVPRRGPGAAMIAAATLCCSSCLAVDHHLLGPAVWPLLIATEATPPGSTIRADAVLVAVAEVNDATLERAPVSDAMVAATTPAAAVGLDETDRGLYAALASIAPRLGLAPDGEVEVTAAFGGRQHAVSGPIADAIGSPAAPEVIAEGEPLVIELPSGYEDRFDQLVLIVSNDAGEVVYDSIPDTLPAWLDFAATRHTPARATVPAEAFSDGPGSYATAVVALRRDRDAAVFSEGLHSELSGFTTGTAVFVVVEVEP